MRHTLFLAILIAGVLAVFPANADVYQLTVDNCSGGCNPNPPGTSMGSVTVVQSGTNNVQITVALNSPLEFVNTGLQETIDFNIVGTPTIAILSSSNANFSLDSTTATSEHFDGFGDFEYALKLNTAQGAGGAVPSPETFVISCTGCTPSSFATTGTGAKAFFGVDVYNTVNGNTGPIGTGAVPEPTAIAFFGTGLVGLGFVLRRRFAARA